MPTNVYDVTFPPDTQLANLLGQDLRNFRLDVQQRMALISGTLAARWNPATDAQPLNWTGLLYFATDTGQTFQWTGAAWIQVAGLLNVQGPAVAIVGNGGTQALFSYVLPANTIPNLRGIRITCNSNHSTGVTNITYNVTLNGVQVGGTSSSAGGGVQQVQFQTSVINTGVNSGAYWQVVSGMSGPGLGTLAGLNWAANQTIALNSTNMPNTDQVTPNFFVVEFL